MLPEALKHFNKHSHNNILRIYKAGPGTCGLTVTELLAAGKNVVLVVPGGAELSEQKALLELMSSGAGNAFPRSPWAVFPAFTAKDTDLVLWAARWAALYRLSTGMGARCALLTVDNLLQKWPPPDVLTHNHLRLVKGENLFLDDLLEQLVRWGFSRENMVSRPGEMAVRGDILDIFAPGYKHPLRFEFFGDTLEDLRLFHSESQRSVADLQEAVLLPVSPALLTEPLTRAACARWKHLKSIGELDKKAHEFLQKKITQADGDIFPGLFYENAVSLRQWFPQNTIWLLYSAGKLPAKLEDEQWKWSAHLDEEAEIKGVKLPQFRILENLQRAKESWINAEQIHFEDLVVGEKKHGIDLPEKKIHDYTDIFWQPEDKKRPWQSLTKALKTWQRERPQTILSFHSKASCKKFLHLAEQDGIHPATEYTINGKGLYALVSPFRSGLDLVWKNMYILSEDVLQPVQGKTYRSRQAKDFVGLRTHADLNPDDLLVHRDWGLGRFGGLHRMRFGDVPGDYLLLFFAGDDKLYLPVDRLNVIQRYKGPEGAAPVLDKLGGSTWAKTKSKAQKAIEKVAAELVEMYAWRKVAKGFSYESLSHDYAEFEASFGFEETPDQEAAIRAVMGDMEQAEPMDRLVCGDVGFGKTEVAMRAAFRAAMAGRQVILLCPTTVLAEQHFQNFKRRMAHFPINVSMLSRFVSPKEQKTIVDRAAKGLVDILIGTHRLLSKDVHMPNLALLVLDEEQRFGVKHKERIKGLRKDIDVLTLTATPIPRTLQLSLSGVRGLSVMETPPIDRKPVQTALLERDDTTLKTIVKRELDREGQVFWVHNRVRSLPLTMEYVQRLVPHARVGMAHGQMRERELEEAIHQFWHGELDILVCTAIIESGLDFPKANTLIVDQAHMFGLGQLYQLRGRVGRSHRQAYAYFVIPSLARLPEVSRKRLQVVLDMDYLGAGFKVAMEDLRLRGAGNILGEAQSGTMAKVGLDLYLEMLDQEVRRLRGQKQTKETSPELRILFEAHIPEEYIPDTHERLRYYRTLSAVKEPALLEDLVNEIRDRFGPLPLPLKRFIAVLDIKHLLAKLQVTSAELAKGRAVLTFSKDTSVVSPHKLVEFVQDNANQVRFLPTGKLELRVQSQGIRQGLEAIEKLLCTFVA